MKKRIIITAAIAACSTLCAAVWPQTETIEETPLPSETPVVYVPEATVEEIKPEVETDPGQRKKRMIFHSQSRPKKSPQNWTLRLRKHT